MRKYHMKIYMFCLTQAFLNRGSMKLDKKKNTNFHLAELKFNISFNDEYKEHTTVVLIVVTLSSVETTNIFIQCYKLLQLRNSCYLTGY